MWRVSGTLEAMAGSLDRLLGFLVADPKMPGDAVHHDPLHCVGARLPLGGQFTGLRISVGTRARP